MKIVKILVIGLVISLLSIAPIAPTTITVFAATTDTVTITFDPQGNMSIDVGPATWNLSTMWADSNESSGPNYFTIWNNGTTDNMLTEARITTTPAGLTVEESGFGASPADNRYALQVIAGSVSDTPWVAESVYRQIDSEIDMGQSDNFGLNMYMSNITTNLSWQTMVVTLRGTSV